MWDSDENGRRVLICDFCGEVIEPAKPGYYGEDYVEVNGECIHTENCMDRWIHEHRKEATYGESHADSDADQGPEESR